MESARWPAAIRRTLGDEGSAALVEVLHNRDDIATDRFERRLSEECSTLRSELRADMNALRSDVIAALADTRADLIKWAFLF